METVGGKKNAQKFNYRQNSFHKRKIALECKSQSNFVYSLSKVILMNQNNFTFLRIILLYFYADHWKSMGVRGKAG